jgi:dTDP-4-dehydrorhamnose 3,5-epimerase
MIFRGTPIPGAYLVDIEELNDIRGFFARIWCEKEFAEHDLQVRMVQASVSFNKKKGTLRGLHYQAPPGREGKFVRCTRGASFNALVDLRSASPAFKKNYTTVLTMDNHRALYVPPGVAFGFQTLVDNTEVLYQMTEFHNPVYARGFRWNDAAFGIQWPEDERTILDRDNDYPDFDPKAVSGFLHYYP